ncbi:MAG: hypothetical protein ABIJ00_12470 [Candidatus Eisenbacteria bacterium]
MKLEAEVEQAIRMLSECLRRNKIRFVLIGARVAEIMIDVTDADGMGYGFRGTADVDFAIRIDSWSEYHRVIEKLIACGFCKKPGTPEHRLFLGDLPVDIIPYGQNLLKGNTLVWPRSQHEMNMTGFGALFELAKEETIGKGIRVPILPVPAAVFSKILAFLDRGFSRDLADTAYMLAHYEEVSVSERRFESYVPEDLPYEVRGALLAGQDLCQLISSADSERLRPFFERLGHLPDAVVNEGIRASRISPTDFMDLLSAFGAGLGFPRN